MKTLFEIITSDNKGGDHNICTCVNSICWHLEKLLNTRQGSLNHIPKYGLPDINEVYRFMPESIDKFSQELIHIIGKYEPRLKSLRIIDRRVNGNDSVLNVNLMARTLFGKDISLVTYFDSVGRVRVDSSSL